MPNEETKTKRHKRTRGRCLDITRFEKLDRLGEGTYGVVYRARDRHTKQIVALKRVTPHHEHTDGFPVTTMREIQSLRTTHHHPNIVTLLDIAVSSSAVFLVFEHCQHDLAKLLDSHFDRHRKSPFSEADSKTLLQQLLSALECVHSHYLIHRDVKLSNLLYTKGILKLADFGLSRFVAASHSMMTEKVASLWYRPPELLLPLRAKSSYTTAIDVWAAGCAWTEFLKGTPLLNGKSEVDQIHKILYYVGPPPPEMVEQVPKLESSIQSRQFLDIFDFLSSEGIRLLNGLLEYRSSDRWTAAQALQSLYFREAPLPTQPSRMPHL